MLLCFTSTRIEALLDRFVDQVRQARRSIFESIDCAVPHASLGTYLKFGLARAEGIAAHLRARPLLALLAERLPATELRLADRPRLERAILGLLHDEALLGAGPLAAIDRYLHVAASPSAVDVRRAQLAARLGRLFEAYGLTAPEIDRARPRPDSPWQVVLWHALYGRDGALARQAGTTEVEWVPACRLVERKSRLELGAPLHVFAWPPLGPVVARLLGLLARDGEVYLYRWTPGLEQLEHPLLGLSEAMVRADEQALAALPADRREVKVPKEKGPAGPLERLQGRAPLSKRTEQEAQAGVRIHACPSVRREIETVAAEIWQLLQRAAGLRLGDIAVVLPWRSRDLYRSQLGAVFRELHDLPHSLIDQPLVAEHPSLAVIEQLMALPLGQVTRQELLRVLSHPSLSGHFEGEPPIDWRELCETLGIVRGHDRTDHEGTYVEGDLLSWDQGLRRLTLGAVMAPQTTLVLDGEPYVPAPHPPGTEGPLMRFSLLARSLLADARFAARARMTLRQWGRFFAGLVGSYLIPRTEEEERIVRRCIEAVGELAPPDEKGVEVSCTVAHAIARERLGALKTHGRPYFAGGVCVGTWDSLRGLPFRALFLLGLGDGLVQPEAADRLDLRTGTPSAPAGETDRARQALCEAVLSARERISLSYLDRDPETGEPLPPPVLVRDLLSALGRTEACSVEELERQIERAPRRRHEDPNLRAIATPAIATEMLAARLGRELRAFTGTRVIDRSALSRGLAPQIRAKLSTELGLFPLLSADRDGGAPTSLALIALRRFLECPLQASARLLLGMRELEPHPADEEPLELGPGTEALLLREVMFATLATGEPFEKAVERIYEERASVRELQGRMPTGLFGRAHARRHLAILRGWWTGLEPCWRPGEGPPSSVQLGRGYRTATGSRIAPALELADLQGRPFRLCGATSPILPTSRTFLLLVARPLDGGNRGETRIRKEMLKPFLDLMLLRAAELAEPVAHEAILLSPDPEQPAVRYRIDAPDSEQARTYLTSLALELLEGMHDYLLPCDAVLERQRPGKAEPLVERIVRLRDGEIPFSSCFGPVAHPESFDPPPETVAEALVARRFGSFFSLVQPVEP